VALKYLSADLAHSAIMRAYAEKRLQIHLDVRHLARPGSPAHEPLDVFVPLLILMPSSLTLLFAFGMLVWIVGLSGVLLFQIFAAPLFLAWRTRRRVVQALPQGRNFVLLWDYGGLALVLDDQPEHPCVAPTGNWREFATRYLNDPADTAAVATG
jgi:protein-S-isoprenylcysteine O-methyltransferase Ste14